MLWRRVLRDDVRPIRPDEVSDLKEEKIPKEVLEIFNDLIVENYSDGHAVVRQDDVVSRLIELGMVKGDIFKKGWLNIEELYESQGWIVKYDKPGYNETGYATFTFDKRTTR